jgi:hypothetical protein
MKLKDVSKAFGAVTAVYDSIENFQRKLELVPGYKEVKEAVNFHEEQRNKLIMDATDQNGQLPVEKQFALEQKILELNNTKYKFKIPLKFTIKEVEDSKIKGSQLVMVFDDFISK